MKTLRLHKLSEAAYTLAEAGVAVGVLGLLGLVFFQVLQSGLTLSAKNTAVNAAHEEARQGILRLTRDLHASVSVPQLRDTSPSLAVISSSAAPGATPPTAAGVSFQNIAYGPNFIFQDPNGSNGMIMIKDGTITPEQGMRLIVPAWGMEDDIVKVTGAVTNGHSNVWTTGNVETGIKNSPQFATAGSCYAITYYTRRVMYVVRNGSYVADSKGDFNSIGAGQYIQVSPGTGSYRYENGELHYYVQESTSANQSVQGTPIWRDKGTVARFLSSPTPFSVPLNRNGGPDNRYIQVKLSARDPKSSNRGYIATSSLLDTQIDYRSRLTVYQ